jgi:hypothetical protein
LSRGILGQQIALTLLKIPGFSGSNSAEVVFPIEIIFLFTLSEGHCARLRRITSNPLKQYMVFKEGDTFMRLFSGLLISTLALGTILTTGCAEHRYQNDPYYGYGGYSGYYGQNDPYYRQWLAERQYNYIEYNRLNRERQREYWEWRRQNEARLRQDPRFRQDQRFRDNQPVARNDRDDRQDRNRQYAQTRNGDRDRHSQDRDRHQVRDRNHNNKDKKNDHDKDRDHDRR